MNIYHNQPINAYYQQKQRFYTALTVQGQNFSLKEGNAVSKTNHQIFLQPAIKTFSVLGKILVCFFKLPIQSSASGSKKRHCRFRAMFDWKRVVGRVSAGISSTDSTIVSWSRSPAGKRAQLLRVERRTGVTTTFCGVAKLGCRLAILLTENQRCT